MLFFKLLFILKERFFKNNKLFDRDSTKWWIPLTYTTECESAFGKTTVRKWLSPNDDSVSIKGPLSPGDWVMFNIEASGLIQRIEKNTLSQHSTVPNARFDSYLIIIKKICFMRSFVKEFKLTIS